MSTPINAYLAGQFDGVRLALQWDGGEAERHVQIRMRETAAEPWGPWRFIQEKHPRRKPWAAIAVHRLGIQMQARISGPEEEWVMAQEVTFKKPVADFEFEVDRGGRLHTFLAGREFDCFIDGKNCHYKLQQNLEIGPGQMMRVQMKATLASFWSQLDEAGDFSNHLPGGLHVVNVGPSVEDVAVTGRDYTELSVAPRDAAIKMVVRRRIS